MCSFLWPSNVCATTSLSIHLLIDILGCFHVLVIVNSAGINTGVHVSFSNMVSLGYMPSSGIVGSYGSFIPSFLRNLSTGCINLHSHQQGKKVSLPFSVKPLEHLFEDGHSD